LLKVKLTLNESDDQLFAITLKCVTDALIFFSESSRLTFRLARQLRACQQVFWFGVDQCIAPMFCSLDELSTIFLRTKISPRDLTAEIQQA